MAVQTAEVVQDAVETVDTPATETAPTKPAEVQAPSAEFLHEQREADLRALERVRVAAQKVIAAVNDVDTLKLESEAAGLHIETRIVDGDDGKPLAQVRGRRVVQ